MSIMSYVIAIDHNEYLKNDIVARMDVAIKENDWDKIKVIRNELDAGPFCE